AEWRARLTPEQYAIARGKGTERPFCGTLLDNKREGVYGCVCCGLPLFSSAAKFTSGTGWPSFFQPVADENLRTHTDHSCGMVGATARHFDGRRVRQELAAYRRAGPRTTTRGLLALVAAEAPPDT